MILITGNSRLADLLSENLPRSSRIDDSIVNNGDIAGIRAAIETLRPETVINCREYSHIDEAEYWRGPAYDINSFFACELARICADNSIKFVYTGTSHVFNGESGSPYTENDQPDPRSFYADSKLLGERLISETGCELLIVRFPDLFDETIDFSKNDLAIRTSSGFQCIHNREISPVFLSQAASAIAALLNKSSSGLFHFSQGDIISPDKILSSIYELLGPPGNARPAIEKISRQDFPAAADTPLYNVLDNSKFISETGIVPESFFVSLNNAVNANRDYYIKNFQQESNK